jgi:hypothetical protein
VWQHRHRLREIEAAQNSEQTKQPTPGLHYSSPWGLYWVSGGVSRTPDGRYTLLVLAGPSVAWVDDQSLKATYPGNGG